LASGQEDAAHFYLGKLHYLRGDRLTAGRAWARVGDSLRPALAREWRARRLMLELSREQPPEPEPAQLWTDLQDWTPILLFNLGAERARAGGGPTLIELVSYRGGAHSTSDDPSRYRPKDEWAAFPLGDPVQRLQAHLIRNGAWCEERQQELEQQQRQYVTDCWKEACSHGTMSEGPFLDVHEMFEDVFEEMPPHLEIQQAALLALEER